MGAPAGMVMDAVPPKVSLRSEPGTIDAPASRRAMWAEPMTRLPAPKVDSRTRT
jgi:hypothetical protein